jgi:hypothetical protein
MIHEAFDMDRWLTVFPLAELRATAAAQVDAVEARRLEPMPTIGVITSPYHLAVIEQVRREVQDHLLGSDRVAADIFTYAVGESGRRDVTKTGGLPYWPVERPWPWSDDEPAVFLAQLSFVDSRDLLTELPGDILLVFAHRAWIDPEEWDGWRPNLVFAWQSLGDHQLVNAEDIPSMEWGVIPCYGAIFRSWDNPGAAGEPDRVARWRNAAILNGTKIGGTPKGGRSPYMLNARFLGSIGSVDPVFGRPWPFLNVEQPITTIRQVMQWHNRLNWGDQGRLDLYFDGERVLPRIENS